MHAKRYDNGSICNEMREDDAPPPPLKKKKKKAEQDKLLIGIAESMYRVDCRKNNRKYNRLAMGKQ